MSAPGQFPGRGESDALANVVAVLRRRWFVIVGVLIACVVVAAVKHAKTTKTYQATANVAFQSGTLSDQALQVAPSGGNEPQREADTQQQIAHSREVAEGVRKQLHLSVPANSLLEEVKIETAPNANVLNIIATTHDPRGSARLANAFAEQYIAFRASSELAQIATAQTKLQQQISELATGSPERALLGQSLRRLGELRAVAGGGANIIGRATPPSSPSGLGLGATAVIGLLIGLAIAFSLVFLLESLDRRIKSIEDFEREYRLPALAAVPQVAFRHQRAIARRELLEPYRILRSALDFAAVTRQLDTLLITSAVPGEGKTTVAVDLAHAIALTGRRTVLVELDLRRPTIADHFGIDGRRGLTTALTGGGSATELLTEPVGSLPNLSVLTSGRLPQNPSELLGSPQIADIIAELTVAEGIVIVDAPPLNPVADTQVLLNNPAIHASVVVGRVNKTTRDEVRRARAILDRHMVEPIGVVVTGLRDTGRYGYSSYSSASASLDVDFRSRSAEAEGEERPKLRL
jgi:capsular exopolysaccharide synthesis family protein